MAQFEILTHLGYPLHVYTVRLTFSRTTGYPNVTKDFELVVQGRPPLVLA